MNRLATLLQQKAVPGPALHRASADLLNGLLADLYRRAAGQAVQWNLPLRVVDDPLEAHAIFRSPDRYPKNYDFLEALAQGRFSSNGADWQARAPLTQRYYSLAVARLGEETVCSVYRRHLARCCAGADLFHTYLNAATEAVSLAFGLPDSIPWPAQLVDALRQRLQWRQAMDWVAGLPEWHQLCAKEMNTLKAELQALWLQHPELQTFLKELGRRAGPATAMVPWEELLQNLFAATETTASSLCWMVDALSRHAVCAAALQKGDEAAIEHFIHETLRLFPPVPMVTRVCTQSRETLLVSLVGLHTHPSHWVEPLRFWPDRPEWKNGASPEAFMPFLVGPRVCGGRKLAMVELRMGLSETLARFDVLPAQQPLAVAYALTSRPGAVPLLRMRQGVPTGATVQ